MLEPSQVFTSTDTQEGYLSVALTFIAFFALGAWMVFVPHHFDWNDGWRYTKISTQITGALSLSFSSLIILKLLSKYFHRNRFSIQIDHNGIWATKLFDEIIPWTEIESIELDGSTAVLRLTEDTKSKIDRNKLFHEQQNVWSKVNMARLSLLNYNHSLDQIWNALQTLFERYNGTKEQ